MARRLCQVGRHPRRDRVETALSSGMALVVVQRKFEISKSVLDRHRRRQCGCFEISGQSLPAPDNVGLAGGEGALDELAAIEIKTAEDVLDAAQRFLRRLDRLAVVAERSGDVRGAVSAISAISKSLEGFFGKVHGLVTDAPVFNIDARKIEIAAAIDALPPAVVRIIAIDPTPQEAAHAIRAVEELRRTGGEPTLPLTGGNEAMEKQPVE